MRCATIIAMLAACSFDEPRFDGTSLRCDDSHACPPEQQCVDGRCVRAGGGNPDGVLCGAAGTCAAGDACCVEAGTPKCIPSTQTCQGQSTTCDGIEDCDAPSQCCYAAQGACGVASCAAVSCVDANDCPPTTPMCCIRANVPWGICLQQC